MKKILFAGGIIFAVTFVLIMSNFSFNSEISESSVRSIDLNDSPSRESLALQQTDVGNQYLNPIKKSVSNSNWEETHILLDRTTSSENFEQNVTFDFYSEMPTPSQKVLDRIEAKSQNPTLRKIPMMPSSTSEINPTLEDAINIDEFLDIEKKS